jgi:hypothetical protein
VVTITWRVVTTSTQGKRIILAEGLSYEKAYQIRGLIRMRGKPTVVELSLSREEFPGEAHGPPLPESTSAGDR